MMRCRSIPFALTLVALAAALLMQFGCASADCDPDERLGVYIEAYREARENGTGAYADLSGNFVIEDCGGLMQKLEELSLMFPNHAPTLMANALIRHEAGEAERAQFYLDQLFRGDPRNADAAVLRAQIALGEGNLPYARQLLEEQVRLRPDHPKAREVLASVYFLYEEYPEAKDQLQQAERLGAPLWRVAYNLGLILENEGDVAGAMKEYRRALKAKPDAELPASRLRGLRARAGGRASAES